ncbi:MAG: epoxyqueuosine reductase [Desulfobacter sp.]|nr:epoxyqueuosine reductase [Desulfobacter sp.]WDP84003.1 MAG: epoxyqueuosine reductase [Desulfobacter sp.]
MNIQSRSEISSAILSHAKDIGASLAGFASVKALKCAPSFTFAPHMPVTASEQETWEKDLGLHPGEVAWPEQAKILLVIGLSHPEDEPEMDWWLGLKNPSGNRRLIKTIQALGPWIEETYGIKTFHLPYRVEKGGTYLKDAAVLAGMGCIGKNNLLVTPQFGPRIRLRAMTLDVDLPSTGPVNFDPCTGCEQFCRNACPPNAFSTRIYTADEYDQSQLPGRDGRFSRPGCQVQMDWDERELKGWATDGADSVLPTIKYCRNCELACPVGRTT